MLLIRTDNLLHALELDVHTLALEHLLEERVLSIQPLLLRESELAHGLVQLIFRVVERNHVRVKLVTTSLSVEVESDVILAHALSVLAVVIRSSAQLDVVLMHVLQARTKWVHTLCCDDLHGLSVDHQQCYLYLIKTIIEQEKWEASRRVFRVVETFVHKLVLLKYRLDLVLLLAGEHRLNRSVHRHFNITERFFDYFVTLI